MRAVDLAISCVVLVLLVSACGGHGVAVTTVVSTSPAAVSTSSTPSVTPAEALISKTKSGIIRIQGSTCDGLDIGTGFLVGPRLVATVEHVVDGAASIALLRNGVALGRATVIGEDPARDLALLRTSRPIRGYQFQLAAVAPSLGEDVLALGFPFGLPLTVTKGSVSGLGRTIAIANVRRRQLVQTDAAVNPGNSGGPLLATDTGQVVGLVDLGSEQANGISFAVSAAVAGPLLQAWRVAPQPVAAAYCAGVSSLPTSSTGNTASGSDLVSYARSVARLLEESAAVRKQLVAAVSEANRDRAAAAQTLALIVAARNDEVASAVAMAVPGGAAGTQAALVRAFRLSLASDLLYQSWIGSGSASTLSQAQANDRQTVVAKAAFMGLYNILRASAGLAPLPADFPF